MTSLSDSRRSLLLYVGEGWRRFSRRLAVGRISALRFTGAAPDRLLVAPTDLRSADPYIAEEIYAGRFALAGRVLETEGASPFLIKPPSADFARALHGFRWLRHLRAANHDLAFANARALTDDWIATCGKRIEGIAWEPDVIARRVIAWLSHSPIVMRGADHAFYRRFLKSLAMQIRYLRHIAPTAPEGETLMRLRIALAMATLALPASPSAVKLAARNLDQELDRQILPDGGHVSRNPQTILDLLADLLPLRQTYANLGQGMPARLIPSIDRMFPALRFFRHGDGELALFNGATATPAERLAAVLRYDESAGPPFRYLPHSRYQRLHAGSTTIIADTGPPPPTRVSTRAHAGCLAFEMSTTRHRIIVNAGVPLNGNGAYLPFARATAAHSTLVLDNTSSARVSQSPFLGPIMTGGVGKVSVEWVDGDDGSRAFTAVHDGYVGSFGLFHERRIRLSGDGCMVSGNDRLTLPGERLPRQDNAHEAVIRFHVHPKVALAKREPGEIQITLPDGETWLFSCVDVEPLIEDDIFFADIAGPRPSRQITLSFRVGASPDVHWTFRRG